MTNQIAVTDNLIKVEQLPVITEQLQKISEQAKAEVDAVLALAVTEDTVKEIKKERANLNRVFKDLEDRRKAVKSMILKPYDEFEKVYKLYITDVFSPADQKLKEKINAVEAELLNDKKAEIEEYFSESIQGKGLEFVEFDRLGIKVLLSSSLNKLKNEIDEVVNKMCEEVEVINATEYADEILLEYKKDYSLTGAIKTVTDRKNALEEERQGRLEKERLEKQQLEREQETEQPIVVTEPEIEKPMNDKWKKWLDKELGQAELGETQAQVKSPVSICDSCGKTLYKGDVAYLGPHGVYCEDCISSWKVVL